MKTAPALYNAGALFITFLCFFCFLRGGEAGHSEIGEVVGEGFEITFKNTNDIIAAISKTVADCGFEAIPAGSALKIRMYSSGMFRASRAELSTGSKESLAALSERLRAYSPSGVHIEGHTGGELVNTPQYPNNWYLSAARAIAVGMFLTEEAGFDAKVVTAEGRGDSVPLDASDNSKNGRIEIIVTP